MLMSSLRFPVALHICLLALLATAPCQAAFHQWRFAEVFSSADGTVQFIELFNPTPASTETQSSTAEIRTDSGNVFEFPTPNISGNTGNKRMLIATDNFESIPGAVTPNFSTALALPPNFFDPAADRLRLFQPSFGEFTAVTWTAATAIPTDNVFSRLFNTSVCAACTPAGIAANSPTNFNGSNPGMTGSINRGDYNSDGLIDTGDYPVWRKTLGETATPAGAGADGDTSATIDEGDYTLWTARFGSAIVGFVPPPPGGGGSAVAPEPATFGLALLAGATLAVFRRWRR
jgi:hypothetical protein